MSLFSLVSHLVCRVALPGLVSPTAADKPAIQLFFSAARLDVALLVVQYVADTSFSAGLSESSITPTVSSFHFVDQPFPTVLELDLAGPSLIALPSPHGRSNRDVGCACFGPAFLKPSPCTRLQLGISLFSNFVGVYLESSITIAPWECALRT